MKTSITDNEIPFWEYFNPPKFGIDSAKRDAELDIEREKKKLLDSLNLRSTTKEKLKEILYQEANVETDEEKEKIDKIIEEDLLSQKKEQC